MIKSGTIILLLSLLPSQLFSQLDAAKKTDPQSSQESAFQKGQRYFYQKKFEMAEVMFLDALKDDPENALTYSYLGDLALAKKHYEGALGYYLKAVELRPESGENNFRLAQTYYYKGNAGKAIEHFLRTYELDNSMKFALYHAGLASLMLNRDKESAVKYWEEYIILAPDDPQKENIERVIELLKNPDFIIPPPESGISVEDALKRGIQKDIPENPDPPDPKLDRYEGLYDNREL
jgi:tetratricopeptide (TPR) repeat protein